MKRSALRAAMDREGPSPEARAVWWAIAAHADADGDAWPSVAIVARMSGMSVRHVTNMLRELERFGMLETTRMPNRKNRYHVVTSAEPQFRFPAKTSGTVVPDVRNPGSGTTGTPVPREVHKEVVHEESAFTPRTNTNGSAATPLRGGGTVCCTSCRKPIVFATLRTGRKVALDAESDPSGSYVLLDGDRAYELGAYQAAAATSDTRDRLHRRHDDVCDQMSTIGDLMGASRVNTWREESRARKLGREAGR